MKINEETGAIICAKCGETIRLRRISRLKGYPTKAVFRCPTKKTGTNNEVINCTGGFPTFLKGKAILKLSNKTRELYKLKKPGEKLPKEKKTLFKRKK